MVVLDATMLMLLMRPDVPAPPDPATGNPVDNAKDRIDYLVQRLDESGSRIIVPTPALSEILVRAALGTADYLDILDRHAVFHVAPFDQRAAVEVAVMTREAKETGDKKGGADGTWNKIKYDRQIVAIARVAGATTIYTDDQNLRAFAMKMGIEVVGLAELPLPPTEPQMELALAKHEEDDETDD